MTKTRLEAFSDGVIAILITILVLELHPPHDSTWQALWELRPKFLTYLMSFVYVAIYWNNHHHMLHATHHIGGAVLWANHHLMFWLSLVPFCTAWLADDPHAPLPTAVYGVVLLGAAMAYTLLLHCIIGTEGENSKLRTMMGSDWKGKVSGVLYALAIPLAFVHTAIAQGVYLTVAIIWFRPDRRIESHLHHA